MPESMMSMSNVNGGLDGELSESMSPWLIFLIVFVIVLVLAGGAFALVWFLWLKKYLDRRKRINEVKAEAKIA